MKKAVTILLLTISALWANARLRIWAIGAAVFFILTVSVLVWKNSAAKASDARVPAQEIIPTLGDIADNHIQFFASNGKPLIGYFQTKDGQIRLFSKTEGVTTAGIKLSPVNKDIVQQVTQSLQAEANQRIQEEQERQKQEQDRHALEKAIAEKKSSEEKEAAIKKAQEAALAETQRAKEAAAAEHAKYIQRYLTAGLVQKPKIGIMAITVVSEAGKLNSAFGSSIAEQFKSASVEVFPSLFTPEFVSDGLFAKTFGGSKAVLDSLDISNSLDVLLLAQQSVQYSTNTSLENVITANMKLEVLTLPVAAKGQAQTRIFTATGVGFKKEDARSQAEERLLKQISGAAKTLFDPIPPKSPQESPGK